MNLPVSNDAKLVMSHITPLLDEEHQKRLQQIMGPHSFSHPSFAELAKMYAVEAPIPDASAAAMKGRERGGCQ